MGHGPFGASANPAICRNRRRLDPDLRRAETLALSARHGFGMPATFASIAGYGAGAVFSYCGHRFVTFMSDGAVGFEIVRFACATAIEISASGSDWP